jgi:hypothetical protein
MNNSPIGRKKWAIPEGYIPTYSHTTGRDLTSHDALCILNASGEEAHIEITIFFSDRDPLGPYRVTVPPRRTKHVRFNDFEDPEIIPKGVDYSSLIKSNIEVVVQYTRLDSRQAENALMTTIAFACDNY